MYIAVNLSRYRNTDQVGEFIMNVRVTVCYQLMQICQVIDFSDSFSFSFFTLSLLSIWLFIHMLMT